MVLSTNHWEVEMQGKTLGELAAYVNRATEDAYQSAREADIAKSRAEGAQQMLDYAKDQHAFAVFSEKYLRHLYEQGKAVNFVGYDFMKKDGAP
jgi:hypothetical protein